MKTFNHKKQYEIDSDDQILASTIKNILQFGISQRQLAEKERIRKQHEAEPILEAPPGHYLITTPQFNRIYPRLMEFLTFKKLIA